MVIKDSRTGLQNRTIINKIIGILKYIWKQVNVFDIPQLVRDISCDVKHIIKCYDDSQKAIEQYKKELEKERAHRIKEQNLFVGVLDHLDDMVWSKDMNGRYIVANKAFREKFCYGISWNELQGQNDIELALKFKKLVGCENHTFGEVCGNSDVVIHETRLPRKFLEHGNINGKLMKLIVNKSPVYDYKGEMFATCGTGRDVTDWHDSIEQAILKIKSECSCFKQDDADKILNELNKFKFKVGDHVR